MNLEKKCYISSAILLQLTHCYHIQILPQKSLKGCVQLCFNSTLSCSALNDSDYSSMYVVIATATSHAAIFVPTTTSIQFNATLCSTVTATLPCQDAPFFLTERQIMPASKLCAVFCMLIYQQLQGRVFVSPCIYLSCKCDFIFTKCMFLPYLGGGHKISYYNRAVWG